MEYSAKPVELLEISSRRELYRAEMNCQIIHDNLHVRPGWTQSYLLEAGGVAVGYGSIAVGGPWKGTRTVFELFVAPAHRSRLFHLFDAFRQASEAGAITMQTNDVPLTVLLHAYAHDISSESILFHDRITTNYPPPGIEFRQRGEPDNDWALEVGGEIVGSGGILYHYNRPYGDIYMKVAEQFRQRGLGTYIVQELKRICYEGGSVPCARCSPANVPSRSTLQKAGFVPCAHILNGNL